MNTTQKTQKQIQNEVWFVNGDKVFSGKDTITIVNRFTGEIQEFEMVNKTKNEAFIIKDDGTCDVDTDEMYGKNGYKRMRWFEAKIEEQTNEEDDS